MDEARYRQICHDLVEIAYLMDSDLMIANADRLTLSLLGDPAAFGEPEGAPSFLGLLLDATEELELTEQEYNDFRRMGSRLRRADQARERNGKLGRGDCKWLQRNHPSAGRPRRGQRGGKVTLAR